MQDAPAPDYFLGRVHEPDTRDYPMRLVLPTKLPRARRRNWTTGPVLDQGRTNSCVGHGWKQFLYTTPVKTSDGPSALEIYNQAKLLDNDPSNDNVDQGTSVRAGVQVLQQEGRIKSYVFAASIQDVISWVLTRGPVVLGTLWFAQMFSPDPQGFVVPNGPIVGGHCYELYGIDLDENAAHCINSWGIAWGQQGRFKIKLDALAWLLNNQGEACAAVERTLKSA